MMLCSIELSNGCTLTRVRVYFQPLCLFALFLFRLTITLQRLLLSLRWNQLGNVFIFTALRSLTVVNDFPSNYSSALEFFLPQCPRWPFCTEARIFLRWWSDAFLSTRFSKSIFLLFLDSTTIFLIWFLRCV